jgi:hypothetical protein
VTSLSRISSFVISYTSPFGPTPLPDSRTGIAFFGSGFAFSGRNAGVNTSSWFSPRPSSGGTGKDGGCTGVGSHGPDSAARDSATRSGISSPGSPRTNRLWGTERIRGELLKLGIVVSNRSIRRYRWRKPTRGGTQEWRTFLSNELKGIWAADLLVVHTINYRILYVFFFISHERRELIHFNVTNSPTAAWIWQQLLEATPWGRKPAYLIHDRDSVYGRDFDVRASRLGVAGVRTPPRAPKANSIAERLVETIRSDVSITSSWSTRAISEGCSLSSCTTTTMTGRTERSPCRAQCRRRVQGTVSLSRRRC